jgi:hypothetical protein
MDDDILKLAALPTADVPSWVEEAHDLVNVRDEVILANFAGLVEDEDAVMDEGGVTLAFLSAQVASTGPESLQEEWARISCLVTGYDAEATKELTALREAELLPFGKDGGLQPCCTENCLLKMFIDDPNKVLRTRGHALWWKNAASRLFDGGDVASVKVRYEKKAHLKRKAMAVPVTGETETRHKPRVASSRIGLKDAAAASTTTARGDAAEPLTTTRTTAPALSAAGPLADSQSPLLFFHRRGRLFESSEGRRERLPRTHWSLLKKKESFTVSKETLAMPCEIPTFGRLLRAQVGGTAYDDGPGRRRGAAYDDDDDDDDGPRGVGGAAAYDDEGFRGARVTEICRRSAPATRAVRLLPRP